MQNGDDCSQYCFDILDFKDQIQDNVLKRLFFWWKYQFKDVHFSYIEDEEVIKGINLEVKAGRNDCDCRIWVGENAYQFIESIFMKSKRNYLHRRTQCTWLRLASMKQIAVDFTRCIFYLPLPFLNNITLNNPDITRDDVIASAN
jgi:hypothetical protein